MKSWKIGALAGLIAGILAGIVAVLSLIILYDFGLPFYYAPPHYPSPDISFSKLASIEIMFSIIWGLILGIIYSEIYTTIPVKGVLRGVIYGLILYLIVGIRFVSYYRFYGDIPKTISWISVFTVWIVYGLTLGILYGLICVRYHPKKKELKIPKLDITNGIHPGAIGGLFGGILLYAYLYSGFVAGFWSLQIPEPDIWFILGQFGTHAFFNMIWGIIFGILFVMFYAKIPGKGLSKGIVFGLIIYFITSFRAGIEFLVYQYDLAFSFVWITGAFFQIFTVGIVLGYLYKPPK